MQVSEYIKKIISRVKTHPSTEQYSGTIKHLIARLDNVGINTRKGN